MSAVRPGVSPYESVHQAAKVRPKARSLTLALVLPRIIHDPRIARVLPISEGRHPAAPGLAKRLSRLSPTAASSHPAGREISTPYWR